MKTLDPGDGMVKRRSHVIANAVRRLQRALRAIERNSKRPEAELRSRAETVRGQLAGIAAAVLIADSRGRYVDVNAAAARLTGYSRTELLKMSVWDLTPDVRHGLARRLWREFIGRERMSGIYRLRRKNGRVVLRHYVAASNVLPGIHVSLLLPAAAGRARPAARPKTAAPKRS